MATIINNPTDAGRIDRAEREGTGLGLLLGVILAILLGIMLLAYALPNLRNNSENPGINVPDRVDVNINGGTGSGATTGQ